MSSIYTLITNIISIIASWFKIKSTTVIVDELKHLHKEKEVIKNEIIRELNNNDVDLHYVDRLYTRLRDISKQENKL